jgi:hypothetical protein
MATTPAAILGPPDPEMERIEALCLAAGVEVYHAVTAAGARVRPGQEATGLDLPWRAHADVIVVEAAGPAIEVAARAADDFLRADHHAPGDAGYGRPPDEYLAASSLGQVLVWLSRRGLLARLAPHVVPDASDAYDGENVYDGARHWTVSRDLLYAAAADHCLGAAYRGECPGVEPEELYRWRLGVRAAFQRRPVADLLADGAAARAAIDAAPLREVGGVECADLTASGQPGTVPEAVDASGVLGVPVLYRMGAKEGIVNAPPAAVGAWMAEQVALGRAPWGDPARGFAGVQR